MGYKIMGLSVTHPLLCTILCLSIVQLQICSSAQSTEDEKKRLIFETKNKIKFHLSLSGVGLTLDPDPRVKRNVNQLPNEDLNKNGSSGHGMDQMHPYSETIGKVTGKQREEDERNARVAQIQTTDSIQENSTRIDKPIRNHSTTVVAVIIGIVILAVIVTVGWQVCGKRMMGDNRHRVHSYSSPPEVDRLTYSPSTRSASQTMPNHHDRDQWRDSHSPAPQPSRPNTAPAVIYSRSPSHSQCSHHPTAPPMQEEEDKPSLNSRNISGPT